MRSRRSSPGLAARLDPSSRFVPPDGLLPTSLARRVFSRQRSRDSHFEAFPPTGAVAVSRFLPSCRFPRSEFPLGPVAGFRAFIPRRSRPRLGGPGVLPCFLFRVSTSAALAHGFVPGHPPSRFRRRALRHPAPWSLAQQRRRHPVAGAPTLLSFSTLRSRGVSPTSITELSTGMDVSSSRFSPSEL